MKTISLIIARILYTFYGYEALNLCFRVFPSGAIVSVLRAYGAEIGEGVRIQSPFVVHNADQQRPIFHELKIGNSCYIGRNCLFDLQGGIFIEDRVTISHGVILNTHTNAGNSLLSKKVLPTSQASVRVKTSAYLGLRVTVLQGVNIGEKSVIGAHSLVNKNVPSRVIAFGQPCRVQKELDV